MENEKINFDTPQESGIKRVDTEVVVEKVEPHIRSEKKLNATLRMSVNATYPEAGVGNSLNDSVFAIKDFGFGDGDTFEEKRVAWIDVPVGLTVEQVQAQLDNFPKARIYKILSLEPVLTDQQKNAMANGVSFYTNDAGKQEPITMDYYLERQLVIDGDEQPALYKGHRQYRVTPFSQDGQADIDMRPAQYAAALPDEEFVMNEAPEVKKVAAGF